MRDKKQISAETVDRLIEPAPQEAEHVLAIWRMLGGKLNWQDMLICADLHDGDPELLVDGLMCIRDGIANWRDEQTKKT